MRQLAALLILLPGTAVAGWQSSIATDGQVDAFGIVFFFYLFFCYVNITDGYKESVDKGR